MNHSKRIVLDFDDTLAFPKNRDWQNSEPNKPLIEKINKLYDEGWQIDIFTARGSISCSSRKEAYEKYSAGIYDWLKRHDVKYHILSFNKPLAAYYIDDKAMTPEEFLDTDIRQLEGGLSGSDIYTDGKHVHKNDKNAHIVHKWFMDVRNVLNVPHIDRVVGETITMEYIWHDPDFFRNNHYRGIAVTQEALMRMKILSTSDEYSWESYVDRIQEHVNVSNDSDFQFIVNDLRNINALNNTFSHGDFGVTNMLFNRDKLFLIDPIPDVFGCTELDAAKLCASLIINKYPYLIYVDTMEAMCVFNEIKKDLFIKLIRAELMRVYKYHPDKKWLKEKILWNVLG